LTFDDFCQGQHPTIFDGSEIAGLFVALSKNEGSLDNFQRSALERLRAILYETLSIDDLENMQAIYENHATEKNR
jgi:hypothetical protein